MSVMDPVDEIVDDFDLTPELGALVVERRNPPIKDGFGGFVPDPNPDLYDVSPWSAHNVEGRTLQSLPEADRNTEVVQFYARDLSFPPPMTTGFRVADGGKAADVVLYLGRRFRVAKVRNFSPQGRAWCVLGVLEETQTTV